MDEQREEEEISPEFLSPVPVRDQQGGFVKPKFSYFQVPANLVLIMDRLKLDFMKESNEVHFAKCLAMQKERDWLIENTTTYFAESYNDFAQEMVEKGISKENIPMSRYNAWARKAIISEFWQMPCPLEVEAVCDILKYLERSYDLETPKIFLVVRELLNQYLIGIRVDKVIIDENMFVQVTNRQGVSFTIPHSGMRTKVDFSELFLKYIKLLDEISRDNIKVSFEGEISLPMVMQRIINLDKTLAKSKESPVIDVTPNEVKQIE